MERDGITRLALDIICSAVNDYRMLKKDGLEFKKDRKYGNFSIGELTEFFDGKWCKTLLSTLGVSGISGADLLKMVDDDMVSVAE